MRGRLSGTVFSQYDNFLLGLQLNKATKGASYVLLPDSYDTCYSFVGTCHRLESTGLRGGGDTVVDQAALGWSGHASLA